MSSTKGLNGKNRTMRLYESDPLCHPVQAQKFSLHKTSWFTSQGLPCRALAFSLIALAAMFLCGCTQSRQRTKGSVYKDVHQIHAETVVRVYCNEGPYLTDHQFTILPESKKVTAKGREPQGMTQWLFDGRKVTIQEGKRTNNKTKWTISYNENNGSLYDIMYDQAVMAAVHAAGWVSATKNDIFSAPLDMKKVDGLWYRHVPLAGSPGWQKLRTSDIESDYYLDTSRNELVFATYQPQNSDSAPAQPQITQRNLPEGALQAQFYNYMYVKDLQRRFPAKIDIYRMENGTEVLRMQITFTDFSVE